MTDLPEVRTVDLGILGGLVGITGKLVLDFFKDRDAARLAEEKSHETVSARETLLEDTKTLRVRMHTLTDTINRDFGSMSNRVTRLEQREEDMTNRLGRIEDKLDRLLDRK